MYMDLQEEMVASTLRKRFREIDCSKELCCARGADEHGRCQSLAMLTGRSSFSSKLQSDHANVYHLGLIGMYGGRSPLLEAIRKSAEETEDSLLVRCRQCGDMISGDIDAIDEHSLICLAVRCRMCGQRMNADVSAIEAHSRVCIPIVEQLSMGKRKPPQVNSKAGFSQYPYGINSVPLPLIPASENHAVGSALLDLSASNLARLSQHVPLAGDSFCSNDDLLRMEVRRQIEELQRLQQPLASSQDRCRLWWKTVLSRMHRRLTRTNNTSFPSFRSSRRTRGGATFWLLLPIVLLSSLQ
jgi:hypothetical protein